MSQLYVAAESTGRFNTTFYTRRPPVVPYKYDIVRGSKVTMIDIFDYNGEKWACVKRHDKQIPKNIGFTHITTRMVQIKYIIAPNNINCIGLSLFIKNNKHLFNNYGNIII